MEEWQERLADEIAKQRRQGWGWRWNGLDGWSTEAIFAQLQKLGIDTDAARFRERATAAGGFEALRKGWASQILEEFDTAFWPDFPLIAAPLLWERLTPDVACPELIGERLRRAIRAEVKGVELAPVDGVPGVVAAMVGLANHLDGFPVSERAKRFEEISDGAACDCENWILDVIRNLGGKYPDVMLHLADTMATCVDPIHYQSEAAMVAASAGRREQAIARARAMVDRFRDDPWSWIYAGDVHQELGDIDGAKRYFTEVLQMPCDSNDREVAVERLDAICKGSEPDAESEESFRRYPMPKREPPPESTVVPRPSFTPKSTPASAMSTRILNPPPAPPKKKVGRTDPCPCGSGMKYKKCCGGK